VGRGRGRSRHFRLAVAEREGPVPDGRKSELVSDCLPEIDRKFGYRTKNVTLARVVRFFLAQHTKTGKNTPQKYQIDGKIDKTAIKFTNVYHCKTL
jgi:hypothetical protein